MKLRRQIVITNTFWGFQRDVRSRWQDEHHKFWSPIKVSVIVLIGYNYLKTTQLKLVERKIDVNLLKNLSLLIGLRYNNNCYLRKWWGLKTESFGFDDWKRKEKGKDREENWKKSIPFLWRSKWGRGGRGWLGLYICVQEWIMLLFHVLYILHFEIFVVFPSIQFMCPIFFYG